MSLLAWYDKRQHVFSFIGCILFFSVVVIVCVLFLFLVISCLTCKIERWMASVRFRLEEEVAKMSPSVARPSKLAGDLEKKLNWLMDPRAVEIEESLSVESEPPWRRERLN